jgi:carbon storage regulator
VLVLTRKTNQSIAIGEDVRIIVVGIEGDKVKLGIVAPPERSIRRIQESPRKPPTSR